MSLTGGIVTYALLWWLFFFMALPMGVRENPSPEPGHDPGAPERPHLLLKALIVTVLAGLGTWGVAWLIDSGLIQLRPSVPPG